MSTSPRNLLICEDHQIVIDGLVSIIKNESGYVVLDAVKDGNLVLNTVKLKNPDAILLDLNLPNKNGLELIPQIKAYDEKIKIIVLTMYNSEGVVKKVKGHNANGFLLKNCSSEDLFSALDSVFESDKFYLGKGVKITVYESDGFLEKIKITRREKEIISELMKGRNVPQIAKSLYISTHTVETHKKNIFKKLNVHNSIDLIKLINEKKLFES